MNLFCKECGNLLENDITEDDRYIKICSNCLKEYEVTPEDSLIDNDTIQTVESMEKFNAFIKLSAFDPTNQKVINECPKCKKKVVTMIQITEKVITMYTCTCGNIWT